MEVYEAEGGVLQLTAARGSRNSLWHTGRTVAEFRTLHTHRLRLGIQCWGEVSGSHVVHLHEHSTCAPHTHARTQAAGGACIKSCVCVCLFLTERERVSISICCSSCSCSDAPHIAFPRRGRSKGQEEGRGDAGCQGPVLTARFEQEEEMKPLCQ